MKATTLLLAMCVLLASGALQGQSAKVRPYRPGEGLSINAGKKYNVRLSGIIQPMVESRRYPSMKEEGTYNRFRMRRMIAKITGNAAREKIGYQLQVDLTGSSDAGGDGTANNYLMDAWVSYEPNDKIEFVFGQENAPTDSRELGMLSNALSLVERSPVALAFASIREFGLFANSKLDVGRNGVLQPHLAITNGDGANVFGKDYGGLKYGGRIDYLPFGAFTRGGQYRQADIEHELMPKLVMGITYSLNQGISDRRGRQSGTILYLDSIGNESLPDYTKASIDFLFKYRGFSMLGEFVNAEATVPSDIRQRVRADGSTANTFLVNGIQNIPSYVRSRMILGSGFNVQAGYYFLNGISVDARYSKLSPAANSFLRNGLFYNRSDYYTACLSKYLGRNYAAKVQAMVTYAKPQAGSTTLTGQALKGNEITSMLMFTFAL